ncbi:BMP family lipoprotein [Enterococcus olivae]
MKKAKLFSLGAVVMAGALLLGACGNNGGGTAETGDGGSQGATDAEHSVAIITDIGGVDDRSFNQSAWEGLQAWGEEHGIARGVGGFDYIQSDEASQYATNISNAVQNGFKTVFGVGFLLQPEIEVAAQQFPDTQFGIVDSVIEGMDNVVSATFRDHEASYLAGVAAAYTTKTDQVGFIGGEEGFVIDRFEAGFVRGVEDTAEKLGKEIEVDVQYAASFNDSARGKAIAASMYQKGIDIIFHASGGTGAGVFQEARAINEQLTEAELEDSKVWVIGVDSDQEGEGAFTTSDDVDDNFTLTSTLKGVGAAVQDISTRALNDEFPGGEHIVYGLSDGGVDLTEGFLSDDAKAAVAEVKDEIIAGSIEVPETPGE